MSDEASSPVSTPRYLIILSTVLAVVLIIAVITAAKITVDRKVYAPVALGPVDAPEASSQVCADFVAGLPEEMDRFRAVEVRDPRPDGTAAYRDSSGSELSVRCGVNVPDQYTELSPVVSEGDTRWTVVSDATPGSDLRTWYAVGGSPAVAVTTSADVGDAAVAGDSGSREAGGSTSGGAAESPACHKFLGSLPEALGDWRLVHRSAGGSEKGADQGKQGTDLVKPDLLPDGVDRSVLDKAPSGSATYLAEEQEPVVIRCGLAMPKSYAPGAQLTQVNKVPWFSDPSLSRGSTMGRWFALGHEQVIGLAMPQSAGNEVISSVSSAISTSLKNTEKAGSSAQSR